MVCGLSFSAVPLPAPSSLFCFFKDYDCKKKNSYYVCPDVLSIACCGSDTLKIPDKYGTHHLTKGRQDIARNGIIGLHTENEALPQISK